MRGCACRGNSSGFVHIKCLTDLAASQDPGNFDAVWTTWTECGNCKQKFAGALGLEMKRRFWRYSRSGEDPLLLIDSASSLASSLVDNAEIAAANQLLDEASNCLRNNKDAVKDDAGYKDALLDLEVIRAEAKLKSDQKLEALGLLQAMFPKQKYTRTNLVSILIYYRKSQMYSLTLVGIRRLTRPQPRPLPSAKHNSVWKNP